MPPDIILALLEANPSICAVKSGDGEYPLHIALRLRAPEQVLLTLIDTYNPEEAEEIEEAEALLSKTHRSLPEFESEFEAEAEAESEAGQGGERQHRHVPQPLVEGGDAPAAAGRTAGAAANVAELAVGVVRPRLSYVC